MGAWEDTGSLRNRVFLGLLSLSFFVFVSGGFVMAYLVLLSPGLAAEEANPLFGLPALAGSPQTSGGTNPATDASSPNAAEPTAQGRLNFLLLGIDQRDDEKGVPTRSDTIMVVSVDQSKKRATMISFARDLWLPIPGFADNRINVANFLGDATKYPGGGPALAAKTIEHNFGIKIDYWARINFRGFEKIVDTLGGVDIDVEKAIRDDQYPTDDYDVMSIYIPAGRQHMDGEVALQYARSRHSENDFGRARRQQRLLVAIRDRAMQLDVIPKLPSLMGTLNDAVETNMPPQEFLRLASVSRDVGGDRVSNLVIDDKLSTPYKGEGGADLLLPKKAEIRMAIGEMLADPAIKEEAAKIEVVNGTAKAGLASKTGDFLTQQGFNVVKVASAERNDHKTTEIALLSPDKKATANLLAESLKLDPKAVVSRPASAPASPSAATAGSDIRITLGQDLKAVQ